MSRVIEVVVRGIPNWVDAPRLLGYEAFEYAREEAKVSARAVLTREEAADVEARLRKVGLGGQELTLEITPKLSRELVREARLTDARRRRDTTPGFLRRGARSDEEGRVSLTPEALALALAKTVGGKTVLDAGCGVGGNAIAFAREGCRVIAIEQEHERLLLAKHNAAVYGVSKKIEFVEGDAVALAKDVRADVLFVDPPWGTEWNRTRTVLDDFPLLSALHTSATIPHHLYKVPPSFDPTSAPGMHARAYFGEAKGDFRRVKFVLLATKS